MNLKNINFYITSRSASASTATGYAKMHAKEQTALIDTAFEI
jgi:2-oxoglutarate dehydrogenase E1 component